MSSPQAFRTGLICEVCIEVGCQPRSFMLGWFYEKRSRFYHRFHQRAAVSGEELCLPPAWLNILVVAGESDDACRVWPDRHQTAQNRPPAVKPAPLDLFVGCFTEELLVRHLKIPISKSNEGAIATQHRLSQQSISSQTETGWSAVSRGALPAFHFIREKRIVRISD